MDVQKLLDFANTLFDMVSIVDPSIPIDNQNTIRLKFWIESGRAGNLTYMKRDLDRTDLRTVMPDVQTVIVVAKAYSKIQNKIGVARFAQGEDYHKVIKDGLYSMASLIKEMDPDVKVRAVVDSAPVFEKAWAVRSGFGWVGKNSLVINKSLGSFFNLGLLLVNKKIAPEQTMGYVDVSQDNCLDCRLCIDACPMKAIGDDRMIDARRCISNLTVEKARHGEQVLPIHGWVYGCDECQISCPFNR